MLYRRNVHHLKDTSQQTKTSLKACVSKTLLGFTSMRACSRRISYPFGLRGSMDEAMV